MIGTYAAQATALQRETVISTGDKDMAQLVTPYVTLVNTMTETTMDTEGVKEKFGVGPERIIDYLALMGDTVDNIPGVPKVGPKTAAKWLNQFGSLEELMARADEVKGKVGESLRDSLEQLPLSQALTTIKCDLALMDLVQIWCQPNLTRTSCANILKNLNSNPGCRALDSSDAASETVAIDDERPANSAVETDYDLILDEDHLQRWVALLEGQELIAVDTETTSIDYMKAELVGFSFAISPGRAAYLPVAHDYPAAPDQISLQHALQALKPVLENPAIAKVGQNLSTT